MLRTWFDGWCTGARFQVHGKCVFGCARGLDSVHHYAVCPVVHKFAHKNLRIAPPPVEERTQHFMLLDTASALPDVLLTRRALLVAAAYRVHCKCRRKGSVGTDEDVTRALEQAAKEAAMGHGSATLALDSRWVPAPGTPRAAAAPRTAPTATRAPPAPAAAGARTRRRRQ